MVDLLSIIGQPAAAVQQGVRSPNVPASGGLGKQDGLRFVWRRRGVHRLVVHRPLRGIPTS